MNNLTDSARDPAAGGSARSTPRVPSSPGEAATAKAAAPETQREDQKMNAISNLARKRLHPDARLLRLGRIWKKLCADLADRPRQVPDRATPEFKALCASRKKKAETLELVEYWIADLPAETSEGMLVKGRVAWRCINPLSDDDLVMLPMPDACLLSLMRDFERLSSRPV